MALDTEYEAEVVGYYADSPRWLEVQEFGNLKVGARVKLGSQRWPDAYRLGTGNVERIFHLPNSSWERTYGRPNVELIVRRDDGDFHQVADYHVELVEVQP